MSKQEQDDKAPEEPTVEQRLANLEEQVAKLIENSDLQVGINEMVGAKLFGDMHQ